MDKGELLNLYDHAKQIVKNSGYGWEAEYYGRRDSKCISESEFLSEYAWVVLNSGFKESIVRRKFSYISMCFYDWQSSATILEDADSCINLSMKAIGSRSKFEGIVEGIQRFESLGRVAWIRSCIDRNDLTELQRLPYIGPVTSLHLAKNLGAPVAKPDRHLERLSESLGSTTERVCAFLSEISGDSIAYVDTVLWRYAALGSHARSA